jgi:arylsulfatase A-like enzyme
MPYGSPVARVLLRAFCAALSFLGAAATAWGQENLPFPPTPTASIANETMQESTYKSRQAKSHLGKDAPNVLIILMDDAGPGVPATYGGEVNTPTLSKVAGRGVSYNRFHSTAMCSPTRASLLCGRNHHRVGAGQIAEFANDWDGYSGTQPKTSAFAAEVLKNYGYSTAAFGKWHNTPAVDTTTKGPFDYWPTGYGFEYFYGFLAGEASQYEPNTVRNTTVVHPNKPKDGKPYHFTEDIADDAILWLREHRAFQPDKPFYMYWAPGAAHGPHHIMKEWADKYKGKFDDGWDNYRERTFKRQKELGWIPANAKLTERAPTMASWASIPEDEKPFQRRLMEIYAGFAEHADYNAGRVIDELEKLGYAQNTLIFYIWGDNGSSAEGQNGTISELLAQNGIPSTIKQHIDAMNRLGGLDVLGTSKADNMYHAGWGWAGSTPYKSTKLVAAHFGGTRQPMAVSWPKKIKPDPTPRSQFLHVVDVTPTIYDVVGIKPPAEVNGFKQDPIDGVTFASTFSDAKAKEVRKTQYFEVMGSRGIYHEGWFACTFGPRTPWTPGMPKGFVDDHGKLLWSPENDKWELYNLEVDWSQADDLAASNPKKLQELKKLFLSEFKQNKGYPVGGGLWVLVNPKDKLTTPYNQWMFPGEVTRMPEFLAPALGNRHNVVKIQAQVPSKPEGVLYALGAFSGGLSCYVKDGRLCYEYNLFEIMRTQIKSKDKLPEGDLTIEVETSYLVAKPGGPLKVEMRVNGKILETVTTVNDREVKEMAQVGKLEVGPGIVPISAPLLFTANDCLDIGSDLGSPVSLDYFDQAPFKFNGKLISTKVEYVTAPAGK